MKPRLVVLGLAAILLAAYFLLIERPRWLQERAQVDEDRIVLQFDPDRIVGIELFRAGDLVVVERDREDVWWIRSPIEYRVKKGAVRNFLDRVLEAERYYEMAETLEPEREEDFGLDEGTAALLTLFDRDAQQLHLRVGKATPTGDAYYFQRGGDPAVYLSSENLDAIRLLNYQSLRDPSLFEIEPGAVDALRIFTPAQEYNLRRDEKQLWRVAGAVGKIPDGAKLKQWILRDAIFELCNARIRAYLRDGMSNEELAVFGLGERSPSLSWQSGERSGGVAMGNESEQIGELFARRLGEDTLFRLPSTLLDFLEKPLAELLDPSPIDADFSGLLAMDARWPDGVELKSVGNGYEQETVIDTVIQDQLSVVTQNVFYGLSRPEIVGSLELAEGQGLGQLLGAEPIVITLRFASEALVLEMGESSEGGSFWLRLAGDRVAYQVERGVYLRLIGWRQAVRSLG